MVLPSYPDYPYETRTHTNWNDEKNVSDKKTQNKTNILNKLKSMVNATFSSINDDDYNCLYDSEQIEHQHNIMLALIKQLND